MKSIGAGPVGLFGAYYAGARGLRVAVVDSLSQLGGQVTAMYPEKQIYDVAGFPAVTGRRLVADLVAQAGQYDPCYLLGQEAQTHEVTASGRHLVTTSAGTRVDAGAVVICGGGGGVMAAAAEGARSRNGVVVGVRPDASRDGASPDLSATLATNMGQARNAIIVWSADAVIAIGGSWGTLSEVALAKRRGDIPVIALGGWRIVDDSGETVPGIQYVDSPESAVRLALGRP